MAVLKATRGFAPGTICKLNSSALVFGRNSKVCDVHLEHFAVSRKHARIQTINNVRYVEDLDSRNGVLVNGQVIRPGALGRQLLRNGDRIEIAAFEFIYDEDLSTDDLVFMDDKAERPNVLVELECTSDSSSDKNSGPQASKLQTLVGIIEDLSAALDLDHVLPKIMASLVRAFPRTQLGCVLLRDEAGTLVPAAAHVPEGAPGRMGINRTIIDEVVEKRNAILAGACNSETSTLDLDHTSDRHHASVMSAPLLNGASEVFGVIQLEIVEGHEWFTQKDIELLRAVARHLAIVIENSRLHQVALREQRTEYEARFRKLMEQTTQGILIHRLFEPLFVNEAWAALHGYTASEVIKMKSVLHLIAPHERDGAMQFAQARLRGDEAPSRYETQDLRRDGSMIWVEKYISVIEWDGQPAVQTSLVDLSQRKKKEEDLRNANDELECRVRERTKELERSNHDLEQFAYSVSHDLQAPLRTITGYCQLLQRRYAGRFDKEADDFLNGTVSGAERMRRLLDDLLAFSRVTTETHPFVETDCNAVITDVRCNLEAQMHETDTVLTTDVLPIVVGDRSQLMQLFQNLIGNAIAYRSERPPRIHVSFEERPNEWEFRVNDNGIGIEERQFDRIFQVSQRLFTESERPGSGIGLSICKRIVERHGGHIGLTSKPGVGSEFFFTLAKQPRRDSETAAE